MASIGSLTANLRLQSAAFQRDLKKSATAVATNTAQMRKSLRAVQNSSRNLQRQFGQLRAGVVGLAGALAVRQFAQFAKGAIDSADSIAKTADSIGLTTDALQEYRVAADLSGVSQEKFDSAIQAFAKRVGEARSNTGTLITFLKTYDKQLLQNLQSTTTTTEALDLFFAAIAGAGNELDRAALSAAAFGRGAGAAMVILLKDGTAGLAEMRRQAVELGLVLEEKLIRAAEATQDRFTLFQTAFSTGFIRGNIIALAGEFQITTENMRAATKAGEQFGQLVGNAVKGMVAATEFVGRNLREIATVLTALVALKAAGMFVALAAAVAKFAVATVTAARAGALLNLVLSKSVLGTIAKLVITLGAATVVWETWGQGAKEAADAIEEAAGRIAGTGGAHQAALTPIQQATQALRLEAQQQQQLSAALQNSAAEYEALRKEIELENEATKLGINLASQQGQAWAEAFRQAAAAREGLEQVQARQQEFARIAEQAFDRVGSAITEAFVQGKAAAVDFKSIALGVVSEIFQAFIRLATINPILNALFGGTRATLFGGGGGFLGSLFGGGGGGGNFAIGIGTPSATLHGGWAGAGKPAMTRRVDPRLFAGAPRLHDGLRPDEFPAILQTGERVVPRGGRGGGDQFIIDARGADRQGMRRLEQMIVALHGSIERRSVAAMIDQKRRGGARVKSAFPA